MCSEGLWSVYELFVNQADLCLLHFTIIMKMCEKVTQYPEYSNLDFSTNIYTTITIQLN